MVFQYITHFSFPRNTIIRRATPDKNLGANVLLGSPDKKSGLAGAVACCRLSGTQQLQVALLYKQPETNHFKQQLSDV